MPLYNKVVGSGLTHIKVLWLTLKLPGPAQQGSSHISQSDNRSALKLLRSCAPQNRSPEASPMAVPALLLAAVAQGTVLAAPRPLKAPLLVFPPPQHIVASGAPMLLSSNFTIYTPHSVDEHAVSATLADAVRRYSALLAPVATAAAASEGVSGTGTTRLAGLRLEVLGGSEALNIDTDYSYTLTVSPVEQQGNDVHAVATAPSVYGAIYAMESFLQMLDEGTGTLVHSSVDIQDKPDYSWRGLMIDSGRRFFPMPLVKNLMQTMVGNKLNVLHLHASDHCRFGVESKLYPELTAALTGVKAGHYSQEDIKEMIAFGQNLGIRVVPEFDMPVRPCCHVYVSGWMLFSWLQSALLLAGSLPRIFATGETGAQVLHSEGGPLTVV
jgi:hypothetical protein